MDILIKYFNSLPNEDRNTFLRKAGLTENYLRSACSRNVLFEAARCVQVERATDGQVTRRDLRPDDWHLIWPELEGK